MTLDELTKSMLQAKLDKTISLDDVQRDIVSRPHYYLISSPKTTREEWEKKQFAVFVDSDGSLVVFLSPEEAGNFAVRNKCVLDGQALVTKANSSTLAKTIAEYEDAKLVSNIRVYSRVPLHLDLSPHDFLRADLPSSSVVMRDHKPPTKLTGTEYVKAALDTFEPNARKKLDPGGRYENIHTLVESLSQQNGLDPSDLDNILNLPNGYTRNFCINLKDGDPSQDVLMKYLTYFGLLEYLYLYKRDSLELLRLLKDHKKIDVYSLKSATINAERFRLDEIKRGRDGNGIFVYRLSLTSKRRSFQMVVSNPLNLVVGREYQIVGLDSEEGQGASREATAYDLPSEETLMQIVSELDQERKPTKKEKKLSEPATYEEERKNRIVRYFREQGMDGRAAESKYKTLEVESDILDEFYKYIDAKQFGKLDLFGYTARRLMKDLHYAPYDAYLLMAQLRADPQNTKQRLKYRETDPQYQKQPAQKGES